MYSCLWDHAPRLLDGISSCVLVYGASGSGKTTSLVGSRSAPGVLPRAVRERERQRP